MTQKRKPRVLLADDELHIRALMKAVIKSINGEIVAEATNGQDAVDLFNEHKPDLMLLDINMPIKTGEEALEEVIRKYPNALVIMLSSLSDAKSVEKCMKFGAANFIRKDTPIDKMKDIIEQTWREFRLS